METKSATQMAGLYGMKSSVAFNKLLVNCGLLKPVNGGYKLADGLRNLGLVTVIEVPFFLPNGIKTKKKKAVWTEKGQEYIHKRLGRMVSYPSLNKGICLIFLKYTNNMNYRVIIMRNDGTQENFVTDSPKCDRLVSQLGDECFKSFTITKA